MVQENRPSPPKALVSTVHASKNGETNEVQQDSPTLTVAKARGLFKTGWKVHIADSAGRRYAPSEFDEILKFDQELPVRAGVFSFFLFAIKRLSPS